MKMIIITVRNVFIIDDNDSENDLTISIILPVLLMVSFKSQYLLYQTQEKD